MMARGNSDEQEHVHDWKVQSMRRNVTWSDRPEFPPSWVGRRPSVRAKCKTCGETTTEIIDARL
jgi:hypothetical protein